MAEQACETYGYTPDPELHKIFTEYSRTHNQGVFDAYTPGEMKKARHNKIITGLPDTPTDAEELSVTDGKELHFTVSTL